MSNFEILAFTELPRIELIIDGVYMNDTGNDDFNFYPNYDTEVIRFQSGANTYDYIFALDTLNGAIPANFAAAVNLVKSILYPTLPPATINERILTTSRLAGFSTGSSTATFGIMLFRFPNFATKEYFLKNIFIVCNNANEAFGVYFMKNIALLGAPVLAWTTGDYLGNSIETANIAGWTNANPITTFNEIELQTNGVGNRNLYDPNAKIEIASATEIFALAISNQSANNRSYTCQIGFNEVDI